MPVVYSLHNPKGLTSLRIRLSHQSILFQLCPYSPLSTKSPYNKIFKRTGEIPHVIGGGS